MTEYVEAISVLAAGSAEFEDAMRAGFEDGKKGDVDSPPSDAPKEWIQHYYTGYIEGVEYYQCAQYIVDTTTL